MARVRSKLEITGLEAGPTQENIEAFKEYVRRHGFQHGEGWYFRTTWLPDSMKRYLESEGLITRVGTRSNLIKARVPVPNRQRGSGYGTAVFYRINGDKI